jgi:amino acid adenylation domain-containing protein
MSLVISQEYLDKLQEKREIEGIYLANSLQQGFIYSALNIGNLDDAYIVQGIWQYNVPIEIHKLKEAWSYAQKRYSSLRLRFAWDEELVQIIDREGNLDWKFFDLSKISSTDMQEFEIKKIQEQDRLEHYKLEQGSLFRVYLIKQKEDLYTCLFSNHHSILDGWSAPILLSYLHQTYLNLLNNEKVQLTADFAYKNSQRYIQAHHLDNKVFWEEYTSKIAEQCDFSGLLNIENKHIKLKEYKLIKNPCEEKLIISQESYSKLKELGKVEGITLNAILQFAWHTVLKTYGGSNQTTGGFIASGRNLPIDNIENAVGLYINTLPLVVEHQNFQEKSLVESIRHIQNNINDANTKSIINLASLQKGGERLFENLFIYENYPNPTQDALVQTLKILFKSSKEKIDYPLVIIAYEQDNQVTIKLTYAGELFSRDAILGLLSTLQYLLQQIAKKPFLLCKNLCFLPADEYNKIIHTWNQTDEIFSLDSTIHDLFEKQVESCSSNIAVVCKNHALTYAQLNEQANQLAHYLISNHHVKSGTLVGICLERNEYLLISILAILKAGGAYVPLDPSTPNDRICYVLEDTNTPVILTTRHHIQKLSNLVSSHKKLNKILVLSVDDIKIQKILEKCPTANPIKNVSKNDLAYVIYTSGTTGKPKGVMIEHTSYIATVEGIKNSYFPNHKNIRTYSVTNYVFDIFGLEYGLSLLSGGKITLGTYEFTTLDCTDFDFLQMTPSLCILKLDALINTSHIQLFVGGESLSWNLLNQILNKSIKVINFYGPTETTIWSTGKAYSDKEDRSLLQVTLGGPLPNEKVYVLDSNLTPLPRGAAGELYIGGIGLGRGYLNLPELTEKSFVKNPFQTQEEKQQNINHKLYKTGDVVRWLMDSNLEYIGRNDFQVKIRGHRIELDEVEHALLSFPLIKQVAVIAKARSNAENDKFLIAYYVSDSQLEDEILLKHLANQLPEYMLPDFFVHLDKLPLNFNGKLDRAALPQPELTNKDLYVFPRTPSESKMWEIWSKLLGITGDKFGVTDNFFRLGGNSVLAIKLISKVNKEFKSIINVAEIFKYNTIELLVEYIEKNSLMSSSIDLQIPIIEKSQESLLSFSQERLWFIEKYEEGSNAYNIPIVFGLIKQIKLNLVELCLKNIVSRHEILRTVIKENSEGKVYQVVDVENEALFTISKVEVASLQALDEALEKQANHIFNLATEYPIKICIYGLSTPQKDESEFYLGIVVHHIAFDGWSIDIFIREFQTYYNHFLSVERGLPHSLNLPDLSIQYKDFALWQRSYLNNERMDNQSKYWKKKLENYETLNFLTDKVRPLHVDYRGNDIHFELDIKTSTALRELAKELKVSLYSLLLSAYYLLLRVYSNQNDIVIGTPVVNRHYSQVENLIGCFINSLALRVQVDLKESVGIFIQRISEEVISAQLYQDLPFEKLIEELKVPKDTTRHPIFQVMFAVNNFGAAIHSSDNVLEVYTPKKNVYSIAKFDLSTSIDDSQPCLKGLINYAISLYNEETIHRFIDTYIEILKQFSTFAGNQSKQNGIQLCQLQYMNEKRYEEIIHSWNQTDRPYSNHKTITMLFEEQVERVPGNIALLCDNRQLTYSELNEKSNQVAHYLKEQYGIASGILIGLYFDRNEHLLIAILAVLKTGAAYVPIDPSSPNDRTLYVLDDTKAPLILTTSSFNQILKEIVGVSKVSQNVAILALDDITNQKILSACSKANLQNKIPNDNLAYVIYTSGTTGKPKGVMIEHKSYVATIEGIRDTYFSNQENIKTYSITNYVFDIFGLEFGLSLLSGGKITLGTHEFDTLDCMDFDFVQMTPSVCALKLNSLRNTTRTLLFVGGESLSLDLLNKILNKSLNVINFYGPTETTIWSTGKLYRYSENRNVQQVSLGGPLSNEKVYVLDQNLIPVPIGAIGELHIGGVGLGRGYLNQPDLTAMKFINNPFQSVEDKLSNKNKQLYKTGDLVRWLLDGSLEYLGRNDSQIKIRGYRIELEEIENLLVNYNGIEQSVVLVKNHQNEEESGTKYLVGYYTAEFPLDNEQIFKYLKAHLPEYMVPNVLMPLDRMPVTVNGKLDVKALPEPEFKKAEGFVGPRNEIEKAICQVWAETLNISEDKIGIHHNFFELGGDSIVAVRITGKLNAKLNSKLRVRDIFELQTVDKISEIIFPANSIENDTFYRPYSLISLQDSGENVDINLIEDIYPASYLQTGMLLESALDDKSTYHDIFSYSMITEYDENKFLTVWNQLISKHELLRACFIHSDTNGFNVLIYKKMDLDWEIYTKKTTLKLIETERSRKFDYSKPGLFRIIVNTFEGKFDFIISFHHAIADGWSIASLVNEFVQRYIHDEREIEFGVENQLKIKYGAFVKKELSVLKEPDSIAFWKEYLKNINVIKVDWKFDEKKSKDTLYLSSFNLNSEQAEIIHTLSKKLKISVDIIFLLAYLKVLSDFTRSLDVTVGLVVNNRLEEEDGDKLFGLFLNTIPFRHILSGNQNNAYELQSIFSNRIMLQKHKFLPYGHIKALFKENLYDFGFSFVHFHILKQSIENLEFSDGYERTNIPVMLGVTQIEESAFNIKLTAHDNYISEDYLNYFAEYFKEYLMDIANNVDKKTSLTALDYQKIITTFNLTEKQYCTNHIHVLFEIQAKRVPENIALIYEENKITYSELNEKANQLAHYLRKQGVKSETFVVTYLNRSIDMVIALLGILKAGGVYIPLDLSYPEERLQFMLEDTKASLLITQSYLKHHFKSDHLKIINLDKDLPMISKEPVSNLSSLILPDNLAYIIYTSGSTGKPKGVENTHSAISNRLLWTLDAYPITEEDSLLYIATVGFDISIWEMIFPLVAGGRLIITRDEENKDPGYLVNMIKKWKITVVHFVPSLLDVFLDQDRLSVCDSIKQVVCGGEGISIRLKEKFFQKLNAKLYHAYGPTEAAISVTHWDCQENINQRRIPIGRPISNTQLYILDKNLDPVPLGICGEIFIGGTNLARSYHSRPELTAEKFIPNPYGNEAVAKSHLRLYRTGDLGRYLPDGNIEFMGRIDEQVKIRGFRIELGEIESTLKAHVDVAQVVVMAREDEPQNKKLVAYIVLQATRIDTLTPDSVFASSSGESFVTLAGEDISTITETLRNYLLRSLPDYMVPSFFVYIDQIPLTPNGKIDRKALPTVDVTFRNLTEYVAPRTAIEEELLLMWRDVLKMDQIGVNDNFFLLGGHSLLATQVISRIRHHYKIDIPLKAIFEQPTIGTLSEKVEYLTNEKILSFIPPITVQSRENIIPLSFAQARLWFLDQLLPLAALYNMPFAFMLEGKLEIDALEKAFNTLVARHESLRTIFSVNEGETAQVILPKLTFVLKTLSQDLSSFSDSIKNEMVEKQVLEEANKPFHLSVGPLIRIQLLILSEEKHVLLITLHHIISDGWSMEIFFRELAVLYDAYAMGIEPVLPVLSIQYADFALWQRKWIQGEVLDNQLTYWKQQLVGIPDLLELPTDKPRPQELTYQGSTYHASLSKEVKIKLNQLAQDNQASLFMVLLSAFQVLLYRYSGQDDIVVGSPIANRNYKETEELIGFFVNTLAFRTKFIGNESFIEILNKIRKITLDAYQHQDMSFEQLVDQLNVNRGLNRNPIFQVMFNFLTASKEKMLSGKIKLSPMPSPNPVAKFDLTLTAYEHEGGIELSFEYMTELFESASIERMVQHFVIIVHEIVVHPSRSICAFPLLTNAEKQVILYQWNATQNIFVKDKCIHDLFQAESLKKPNDIAVIYHNKQLTYAELNKKSNQLAHYLHKMGVGPEALVGICVEKSIEMIVCLLGILKAGGAYVPLDPSYPEDRLQFMLENSESKLLLTQSQFIDKFKNYKGSTVFIDDDATLIEQELESNLASFVLPQNLACLIYTSASSGKPKGVLLSHRLILNRFSWMWEKYPFTQGEVCCQKTSLSFVDAIWEIFGPILKGIPLVILSPLVISEPLEFIKVLKNESVTRLLLVPSLLQTLLDQDASVLTHGLKNLRLCVVSGEALPSTTSLHFQRTLLDSTKLLNLYGSTEIGADATYYELNRENASDTWDGQVPIGRPISNLQIYILDAWFNPVPVGVSGEIYVGGEGLARGYFNFPELTAEKFIPNPFIEGDAPTENINLRLYRTGDQARYLPDGNIEYLGRIDEQVKLRGFRIELGEIESLLKTHTGVKQVVVISREDTTGDKKLIAFIVPQVDRLISVKQDSVFMSSSNKPFSVLSGDNISTFIEELRNYLAASLPEYMIPSFFVFIDEIPLSPNGKTDRKSLPVIEMIESECYLAPRNALESKLCDIWASILGLPVDKIGVQDDFFRLGGNSILAIRLTSKINEILDASLSVISIFKYNTIDKLAQYLSSEERNAEISYSEETWSF